MPLFIEVSNHAVDQLRSRFPEETHRLPAGEMRRLIVTEVQDALVAQRMATKIPRSALRPGEQQRSRAWRGNKERARSMRYLWTPDVERIYLIDRRHQHAVVVTVIRAGAADTAHDVAA